MLTFVEYWNIVDQAVIFIPESYRQPLSVYLSHIISGEAGMIFAASAVYMVPPLLLFAAFHEQTLQGVRLSGIKA